MEHCRYEMRTGCESEQVDLWHDGEEGRIEASSGGMGVPWRCYRLTCGHFPQSSAFGILVVQQSEVRTGAGGFEPFELEDEEMDLPLIIEYLRVVPSPVFIQGGSSLAASGWWNPQFSLQLAVYDYDGRPEKGRVRHIYDLIDKKKLAAIPAVPQGAET